MFENLFQLFLMFFICAPLWFRGENFEFLVNLLAGDTKLALVSTGEASNFLLDAKFISELMSSLFDMLFTLKISDLEVLSLCSTLGMLLESLQFLTCQRKSFVVRNLEHPIHRTCLIMSLFSTSFLGS
jgi:hypothetical protein